MNRIVSPESPVLLVEDEAHALHSTERMLVSAGINNILPCQDSRKAAEILSSQEISVVLLDLSMPPAMKNACD
jgi:DNA-binding NtrC family response regulator